MADIDKKALIDEGCNLLNEAIAEMRKAQKLFKKCGIELCDTFSWGDAAKERCSFTNAQIHNGIKNFEKLSGTSGYFINDFTTGKEDKSRRYAEYNGLKFVQLMHAK